MHNLISFDISIHPRNHHDNHGNGYNYLPIFLNGQKQLEPDAKSCFPSHHPLHPSYQRTIWEGERRRSHGVRVHGEEVHPTSGTASWLEISEVGIWCSSSYSSKKASGCNMLKSTFHPTISYGLGGYRRENGPIWRSWGRGRDYDAQWPNEEMIQGVVSQWHGLKGMLLFLSNRETKDLSVKPNILRKITWHKESMSAEPQNPTKVTWIRSGSPTTTGR